MNGYEQYSQQDFLDEAQAVDIGKVTPRQLLEFVPVIGDILSAEEVIREMMKPEPNWYLVGALAGATIIGFFPGIGDAAAVAIKKGARAAVNKVDDVAADVIGTTKGLVAGDLDFVRGRGKPADAMSVGAKSVGDDAVDALVSKPTTKFTELETDWTDEMFEIAFDSMYDFPASKNASIRNYVNVGYGGSSGQVGVTGQNAKYKFKQLMDSKTPAVIRKSMTPPSKQVYDSLPQEVTLYRYGTRLDSPSAYSWTLDPDFAVQGRKNLSATAKRKTGDNDYTEVEFDDRQLIQGTVDKKDIAQVVLQREEAEILVDPSFVNNKNAINQKELANNTIRPAIVSEITKLKSEMMKATTDEQATKILELFSNKVSDIPKGTLQLSPQGAFDVALDKDNPMNSVLMNETWQGDVSTLKPLRDYDGTVQTIGRMIDANMKQVSGDEFGAKHFKDGGLVNHRLRSNAPGYFHNNPVPFQAAQNLADGGMVVNPRPALNMANGGYVTAALNMEDGGMVTYLKDGSGPVKAAAPELKTLDGETVEMLSRDGRWGSDSVVFRSGIVQGAEGLLEIPGWLASFVYPPAQYEVELESPKLKAEVEARRELGVKILVDSGLPYSEALQRMDTLIGNSQLLGSLVDITSFITGGAKIVSAVAKLAKAGGVFAKVNKLPEAETKAFMTKFNAKANKLDPDSPEFIDKLRRIAEEIWENEVKGSTTTNGNKYYRLIDDDAAKSVDHNLGRISIGNINSLEDFGIVLHELGHVAKREGRSSVGFFKTRDKVFLEETTAVRFALEKAAESGLEATHFKRILDDQVKNFNTYVKYYSNPYENVKGTPSQSYVATSDSVESLDALADFAKEFGNVNRQTYLDDIQKSRQASFKRYKESGESIPELDDIIMNRRNVDNITEARIAVKRPFFIKDIDGNITELNMTPSEFKELTKISDSSVKQDGGRIKNVEGYEGAQWSKTGEFKDFKTGQTKKDSLVEFDDASQAAFKEAGAGPVRLPTSLTTEAREAIRLDIDDAIKPHFLRKMDADIDEDTFDYDKFTGVSQFINDGGQFISRNDLNKKLAIEIAEEAWPDVVKNLEKYKDLGPEKYNAIIKYAKQQSKYLFDYAPPVKGGKYSEEFNSIKPAHNIGIMTRYNVREGIDKNYNTQRATQATQDRRRAKLRTRVEAELDNYSSPSEVPESLKDEFIKAYDKVTWDILMKKTYPDSFKAAQKDSLIVTTTGGPVKKVSSFRSGRKSLIADK